MKINIEIHMIFAGTFQIAHMDRSQNLNQIY